MQRTRTRNLRGLLILLREFGVTSYEHAGTKLTMVASTSAEAPAPAKVAPKARVAPSSTEVARTMMAQAGVSDETAAELAATLGLGS